MKKITHFILIFAVVAGIQQLTAQQVVLQDFETGGLLGPFGGSLASRTANPQGTGQVLMCTSVVGGQVWQGVDIALTSNVRLTTTARTMSMDVYSLTPITIAPKVVRGIAPAPDSTTRLQHNGSGWQTLTFTFDQGLDNTVSANGDYQQFVIYYNYNTTANSFPSPAIARVFYVDNIRGVAAPTIIPIALAVPTVVAPVPPVATRPQGTVRSIFSNSYTPVVALTYGGLTNTFDTSWCSSGVTSVFNSDVFSANAANRVVGLGSGTVAGTATTTPSYIGSDLVGACEGIDFQGGRIDASTFTHLHIDIWTPIRTMANRSLTIKLSNWNTANTAEQNAIIFNLNNASTLPNRLSAADPSPLLAAGGQFLSLDIPLSDFGAASAPANLSRNNIAQIVLEGNLGTLYYDNLYFWGGTLGTEKFDISNVKLYPNPVKNILTIEALREIQKVSMFNILGQEVMVARPKSNTATLRTDTLQKGMYIVKTEVDGKVSTSKMIRE